MVDNVRKIQNQDIIEIQKILSEFIVDGKFDFDEFLKLAEDEDLVYYKGKFEFEILTQEYFNKRYFNKNVPFIIETDKKDDSRDNYDPSSCDDYFCKESYSSKDDNQDGNKIKRSNNNSKIKIICNKDFIY
ncbi:MAG: hypothetical protein KC550_03545 [Nanoarchaeota archaeon]|nr:hypothetical protein [Nanoarchaeota archaeon]